MYIMLNKAIVAAMDKPTLKSLSSPLMFRCNEDSPPSGKLTAVAPRP
jgi:hypothetical protein